MSGQLVIDLMRHAVMTTLLVAGPVLATALIVGVVVSIGQAVTQIQEQTLTFVPKLIAAGFVMLLLLPWVMGRMVQYVVEMLQSIPSLVS